MPGEDVMPIAVSTNSIERMWANFFSNCHRLDCIETTNLDNNTRIFPLDIPYSIFMIEPDIRQEGKSYINQQGSTTGHKTLVQRKVATSLRLSRC